RIRLEEERRSGLVGAGCVERDSDGHGRGLRFSGPTACAPMAALASASKAAVRRCRRAIEKIALELEFGRVRAISRMSRTARAPIGGRRFSRRLGFAKVGRPMSTPKLTSILLSAFVATACVGMTACDKGGGSKKGK